MLPRHSSMEDQSRIFPQAEGELPKQIIEWRLAQVGFAIVFFSLSNCLTVLRKFLEGFEEIFETQNVRKR